jgi:3'-phosphoadenosine 5'-phosphosulfate sulfotransferase (PAPS reductase)/FAD synthetase
VSKTDKTRPWRVNQTDPLNQKFRRVVAWELEWFYKRMGQVKGCWCCSQKHHYAQEQKSTRVKWNRQRRDLEKGGWRE